MNKIGLIACGLIYFFLMSACVSTTSGSITEPKRDDTDAAELNYQLGARYYRKKSYVLARDRLLRATEIDPKMAIAYSTLALTYEAMENKRLARGAYEKAVRVAPKNFDVQNAYAVFLCRQKEYGVAVKYFDKAINHPENDNAYITMTNAGKCMAQKPDAVLAEAYFHDALAARQNHGEALIQLCLLKFRQQDHLAARVLLKRFMLGNIPTAGVLYLAAKIEDMLGNDPGRREFEDRLIRDFPTSDEARKVLGSSP